MCLKTERRLIYDIEHSTMHPAGGQSTGVFACAGLINQLQSGRVEPVIALVKRWHNNCWLLVEGGGRTRPVLLTGGKTLAYGVPD